MVKGKNLLKVFIWSKLQKETMKGVAYLNPPDSVRGMLELRKESFTKDVHVPVLHVKDVKLSNIIKIVKPDLLKIENFKPIKTVESGTQIYLNPNTVDPDDPPENLESELNNYGLGKKDMTLETMTLSYENFSAEQIFRAVLPQDKEGMASFTKIGHILHVNLREHLLPFKKLIGKVLYDKIPGCKTVVNKTNMIDNTYRNFQMEILEGDDNTLVTLKENKCTFEFDFSAVYWNSRLSSEHEIIVKKLNSNDVLFDVFAGVGPFSVPTAKKNCIVYANDLNPESYKWLNHNFKLNKVKSENFKTYNKDGKIFILEEIKEYLPKYLHTHNVFITMNLPAMAVTFLNNFVGLLKESDVKGGFKPVTLFVYCFAKGENFNEIARNLVIENLGFNKIINMHRVRTVSSLKEMIRVTIELDDEVLIGNLPTGIKRTNEDDGPMGNIKKCN